MVHAHGRHPVVLVPLPPHLVAQVVARRPRKAGLAELPHAREEVHKPSNARAPSSGIAYASDGARSIASHDPPRLRASRPSASSHGLAARSAVNHKRCMSCVTSPASCDVAKRQKATSVRTQRASLARTPAIAASALTTVTICAATAKHGELRRCGESQDKPSGTARSSDASDAKRGASRIPGDSKTRIGTVTRKTARLSACSGRSNARNLGPTPRPVATRRARGNPCRVRSRSALRPRAAR